MTRLFEILVTVYTSRQSCTVLLYEGISQIYSAEYKVDMSASPINLAHNAFQEFLDSSPDSKYVKFLKENKDNIKTRVVPRRQELEKFEYEIIVSN